MYEHHTNPRAPWFGGPSRPPQPPGWMRISNTERTEVTNALIRHVAEGRLDEAEFEERAAKAAAAKTRDDLAPLLTDLPPLDAPAPAEVPHRPRHRLAWFLLAFLLILTVGGGIIGAAHRVFLFHVPWFLIVIVAFFVLRCRRRRDWHHHDHV